jgi:DNA adenine methylase
MALDGYDMFAELDRLSDDKPRQKILRAPFGWVGGKSRSIKHLLEHIPYRSSFIDVFGGSGAVTLAREKSKLEVFNDAYSGVTAFYSVVRDPDLFERLLDRLDLTVHSREDFLLCKETWKNTNDPVERAARWYTLIQYSFGSIGRNFGRATSGGRGGMAGKIRNKLKYFPEIHARFRNVQVENLDWEVCMRDYDNGDAVFYCDPPYVDVNRGTYKSEMSIERHRDFLDVVFQCSGFVAVSGYSNPIYENQDWDDRFEWESFVSIQSMAYTETNKKEQLKGQESRTHATEVLWIKEAK